MRVNILEARNRLSQLIKSAQAGQEVVISKRGRPVARLVSTGESAEGSETGSGRHILEWLESHPLPAYARRSAEEIDAAIKEEREGWD